MRILVVGSGAGAHALAWKLVQSEKVEKVFVAPGNPGTAEEARVENVDVASDDIPGLAKIARSLDVNFTLVTPTPTLAAGIVDYFEAEGLAILSPRQSAARLETSKHFSKDFMSRHSIPTPSFKAFTDCEAAKNYASEQHLPLVLKADGMVNGGIGVIIVNNREELAPNIEFLFNNYGGAVLVEEFVEGKEISFTVLYDGETVVPLADSRDYKKLLDGDLGPNTSGMGAYSPVVSADMYQRIMDEIVHPTIEAMKSEQIDYLGFLYFGIIISPQGKISMLEINCRLGNPELFTMLQRFTGDFAALLQSAVARDLAHASVGWSDDCAVAVHFASEGYPHKKREGDVIRLPQLKDAPDVKIFHSSISAVDGVLVSKSGRILAACATGQTMDMARQKIYGLVGQIHFDGMQYRSDIGSFNLG